VAVTRTAFPWQALAGRALSRWTGVEGMQLSAVYPARPAGPLHADDALARLVIDASMDAFELASNELVGRCHTDQQRTWAATWPGEHYRLLPALARRLGGGVVVEVGTFTGMGTLALLEGADHVVTYDLVPWDTLPEAVIRHDDISGGHVEQRIGDLSTELFFHSQIDTLASADLIFIDGPKDRSFEPRFTELLRRTFHGTGKVLVYDDIRVANMVAFWGRFELDKFDATSYGHWSGTGLARL